MGTCEMCGESGTLKETRVEGAKLKLCGDCQDLGEVVEKPSTGRKTASSKSRSTASTPDEEVLPGYGDEVKEAREAQNRSVTELADSLKEKESVVRRVESGALTPDRDLARKFEKELGIEIYGQPPEAPDTSSGSSSGGQTIGDVAEVKRD